MVAPSHTDSAASSSVLPACPLVTATGRAESISARPGVQAAASMIGAKGLGEVVLLGLQRADPGLGFVGGLAIVLLAILLDRMAQAIFVERRQEG